jgi:hypothetical protein
MHEVDSDTWSRSMVATLGPGMIDASREGWMTRRWCHPSYPHPDRPPTCRFEAELR